MHSEWPKLHRVLAILCAQGLSFFSSHLNTCHCSLFVDEEKLDTKVRQHLQLNGAKVSEDMKISVGHYDDAKHFVADLANKVEGKIWVRSLFKVLDVSSFIVSSTVKPAYVVTSVKKGSPAFNSHLFRGL